MGLVTKASILQVPSTIKLLKKKKKFDVSKIKIKGTFLYFFFFFKGGDVHDTSCAKLFLSTTVMHQQKVNVKFHKSNIFTRFELSQLI